MLWLHGAVLIIIVMITDSSNCTRILLIRNPPGLWSPDGGGGFWTSQSARKPLILKLCEAVKVRPTFFSFLTITQQLLLHHLQCLDNL